MKLCKILLDPFLFSSLLKGTAAGVEHRFVLQNLSCECVIDVGANRGQFALISRKIFPRATIHSFEPLEEPAQIFKKIFNNDPNVFFYPYAIGCEKTTATIYVTESSMFPGATEKETRQVTVLPLSQALGNTSIPHASLLKIDVQGFELVVLQGSEDILKKFSHLYIECSFIELYQGQALAYQVISWLEKRNFALIGIYNPSYGKKGQAVQADFLFARK
jgi:FkbM family methyltransferase